MDTINIHYFYGFGLALGQVRILASSEERLDGQIWKSATSSAVEWAKSLTTGSLKALLPKTTEAAVGLLKHLEDFSKLLGQDRAPTAEEGEELHGAITDFYNVFEQEVPDLHCYVVTQVGAYEVSTLLKNASAHLSDMAQKVLPAHIRYDFNRAGECLALDLYTACGFHAMRAVEAQARQYHQELTKVRLEDVPLGTLIYGDAKRDPRSGLKTRHAKEGNRHDDPLGLIISLLSQINAIYRRPIMHPDMALNPAKAKFVFDTAALAISAMVDDSFQRFVKNKNKKQKKLSTKKP